MSYYLLQIKIINESVRPAYETAISKMETEEYVKNSHKDSGFDLFIPDKVYCNTEFNYNFDKCETKLIEIHRQVCQAILPCRKIPMMKCLQEKIIKVQMIILMRRQHMLLWIKHFIVINPVLMQWMLIGQAKNIVVEWFDWVSIKMMKSEQHLEHN